MGQASLELASHGAAPPLSGRTDLIEGLEGQALSH